MTPMTQIARKLGIKYSTAKTLIRNYKALPEESNRELVQALCADFEKKHRYRKRCSYRVIPEPSNSVEGGFKS